MQYLATGSRRHVCPCFLQALHFSRAFAAVAPEIATARSSDEDAIAWCAGFADSKPDDIPRNDLKFSFSRSGALGPPSLSSSLNASGGKGGQNVNKVETKATLKLPLAKATWLPPYVKDRFRRHAYYVAKDDSLQLSSQVHRSQASNVEETIKRLHSTILEVASADLVAPKTPEQLKKEKGDQQRANERRLEDKKRKRKRERDKMGD